MSFRSLSHVVLLSVVSPFYSHDFVLLYIILDFAFVLTESHILSALCSTLSRFFGIMIVSSKAGPPNSLATAHYRALAYLELGHGNGWARTPTHAAQLVQALGQWALAHVHVTHYSHKLSCVPAHWSATCTRAAECTHNVA